MKIFKKFARWWSDQSGGEWHHHMDFILEEGEVFEISAIGVKLNPVAKGKIHKYHLHFCYCEDEEGKDLL